MYLNRSRTLLNYMCMASFTYKIRANCNISLHAEFFRILRHLELTQVCESMITSVLMPLSSEFL